MTSSYKFCQQPIGAVLFYWDVGNTSLTQCPAVTNLTGPLQCDRKVIWPLTSKFCPSHSQCFLWVLHQTKHPKDLGNIACGVQGWQRTQWEAVFPAFWQLTPTSPCRVSVFFLNAAKTPMTRTSVSDSRWWVLGGEGSGGVRDRAEQHVCVRFTYPTLNPPGF